MPFPSQLTGLLIKASWATNSLTEAAKFAEQPPTYQILTVIYVVVLAIYALNSALLIAGALATNKSLKMRLKFERTKRSQV